MKKLNIRGINHPRLIAVLHGFSQLLFDSTIHIHRKNGFIIVDSRKIDPIVLKRALEQNRKCQRACTVTRIKDC